MNKEAFKVALIYILVILGLIKVIIVPGKNKLEDKKRGYEGYVEIYFQKKRLLEKRKKMYKAFSSNQTSSETALEQEKLPPFLYAKSDDPIEVQLNLITYVKKLAEEHKLEMPSFNLLPIYYGKRLVEIPVSFKLKGSTKNILEFIKKLQSFQKDIYFKEVLINENRRQINLDLTLSVLKSEI